MTLPNWRHISTADTSPRSNETNLRGRWRRRRKEGGKGGGEEEEDGDDKALDLSSVQVHYSFFVLEEIRLPVTKATPTHMYITKY